MTKQAPSSVERALAILDSFRMGDQSLSLAELAKRTGLYKSTILRLTEILGRHNYLERLDAGGYQLGAAAIRLGEVCKRSNKLEEVVLPFLRTLVASTGESAALVMRRSDAMVCLRRVDGPRMFRESIREGDVLPLVGAPGRIFRHYERLGESRYKGDELDPTLRSNPPRPLPIVTRGEYDTDLASLACGVFGTNEELLGVITLTGSRNRFDRQAAAAMGNELRDACEQLTLRSGGSVEPFKVQKARS